MYKKIENRFDCLFEELMDSHRMQNIYANQGLESIADKDEIEKLKTMGIYGGKFDVGEVRRVQIRMYELTSQILICADILEKEDSRVDKVKELHSALKEVFSETYVKPIKNYDYQKTILGLGF